MNQYSNSAIGTLIETLNDSLEKITESETKKVFYDTELGKTITAGISKVVDALNRQKTDFTPIENVVKEIARQNKALIDKLEGLMKPENNDAKYQELLKLTLAMVAKNNEFLQLSINNQSSPLPIVSSKPTEWEFLSVRDQWGNLKTTAKSKY